MSENEYGTAMNMSEDEKKISFLNRYFVFKKMHTVNTENLYKIVRNRASIEVTKKSTEQATDVSTMKKPSQGATEEEEKELETTKSTTEVRTKKLNSKITIGCKTEEIEPTTEVPVSQNTLPPTQRTITVKRPIKKV